MKHKVVIILLFISALFSSCEDVVEISLSDEDLELYAVEARITTNSNPYVFLYKSQLVSSDTPYPGISGAAVVVTDNSNPQKSITLQAN